MQEIKSVFIIFMEVSDDKDTPKETVQRSEEVQTIIDRMPTRGATYAIDGQISITSHLAPSD